MAPPRLLALCLLLPLLPACGYDTGADLRPVVERITPSGARPLAACGGSSGLIDEPSYGCKYLVRGEAEKVSEAIASALRSEGFAVSCPRAGELAALRRDIRVTAEVTPSGWISHASGVANVFEGGHRPEGSQPIPKGSVALDLDASRQSDASSAFWRRHVAEGLPCNRSLVQPHPLEHCVTWWNGPVGMETSEAARRRHAGPAVQITRTERPGVSTCTCTVRVRGRFQRVIARFDHGDWIWPPLRAVAPPRRFQPNARLEANGWLGLKG